jgi:hypothetical protein
MQATALGGLPEQEVHRYITRVLLVLAPVLAALVAIYVIRHRRRARLDRAA